MNKITKEMINGFNKFLEDQGSILRLKENTSVLDTIDIVLKYDPFLVPDGNLGTV